MRPSRRADGTPAEVMFQSSPGSVAGCDALRGSGTRPARAGVSILTRLGGRVRPHNGTDSRQIEYAFQSSPGSVAGCDTPSPPSAPARTSCFNPHPARWPGATLGRSGNQPGRRRFQSSPGSVAGCDEYLRAWRERQRRFQSSPGSVAGCDAILLGLFAGAREMVSILTRLGGRVRLGPGTPDRRPVRVSILTRLGGRVRPISLLAGRTPRSAVSILTRLGGRVRLYGPDMANDSDTPVSILTRLGGRVRPGPLVPRGRGSSRFNPHPARWPGATLPDSGREDNDAVFQSSPGSVAGCDQRRMKPVT